MKKSINLSLGKKRVDNALRKVFIISAGVFILLVVVSIGLIIYRLVLKNTFDSLDAKERGIDQELLTLQLKKTKLLETKQRIGDINRIITKRAPTAVRINSMSQFVPEDVEVESLNGTDKEIVISLESENLDSLNQLLEEKVAQLALDKGKGISTVNMQRFGLNPKTLKYSVSFSVKFI